jgi:enoyl-CoA hydratase/carnithine racemase
MTTDETIILERHGAVAVVRLNRIEKHNAISRQLSADLIACLAALEADDSIGVIVVTGAGDKAFCAGADMAQAALGHDRPENDDGSKDFAAQAVIRLGQVRKPVIGAINGYAYGGGAVLALGCDIRICSENAEFRFVGAVYGLVVGASRLPSVVGAPIAKELIFTARTVDADEALRIGLANHVVPRADLERTVMEMAAQIAEHSPPALIASKEVIDLAAGHRDAARRELEHNLELRQSEEHLRRFRAAAERVVNRES